MWGYIIRRLIQSLFVLLIISGIVFMLTHLSGDPATLMARPDATFEEIEEIKVRLGLDQPLHTQYGLFLSRAVRGDFGESFRWKKSTLSIWMDRFPHTLKLAGVAFLISVILGISLGILGAIKQGRVLDHFARIFAFMGVSFPVFWLGLMLMLIFGVHLRWLPVAGMGTWKHLVMPAFVLGWIFCASQVRLTRSAMLDVLDSEYIKMARIKGVPGHLIIMKHAFRNALIPVVTMGGLNLVGLLTGTVITETVFNWRGIGWLAVDAVYARDFPLVQTCVLLSSSMLIFMNLFVDILYAYIDPRIRYR